MKKLFLTTLISLIFLHGLSAQRYKTESVTVKYQQKPLQALPGDYSSYNFIIEPGGVDFKYIRSPKIRAWNETDVLGNVNSNYGSVSLARQEFMNLTAYEKDSINPQFIIQTSFQDLKITDKTVIRHDYCSDVSAPCYAYLLTYTFGARLKVLTSAGDVLIDTVYSDHNSVEKGWFGKMNAKISKENNAQQMFKEANGNIFGYKTTGELSARFQQNEYSFIGQLVREALIDMEELVVNFYDYPTKEIKLSIAHDRSTRKLNYDDINKALEDFKKGVELFNESYDDMAWKPIFKECIKTWESALEETNVTDRKARIHANLAPSLYANIAIASMWMRDWAKFDEAIDKGLEIDPEKRFLTNLRDFGYSIKERY